MVDILKKYRKKKNIQNIWLVLASLALAIWINSFVFKDTNVADNLKTNINETVVKENNADLYIEKSKDIYKIKVWQDMQNVENISFSLTYNSDNLKIDSMEWWSENIDIMNLSNYPWVNTVVINLDDATNFSKWEEIITLRITKSNEIIDSINVISANFTDSEWETYLLSTSWIDL